MLAVQWGFLIECCPWHLSQFGRDGMGSRINTTRSPFTAGSWSPSTMLTRARRLPPTTNSNFLTILHDSRRGTTRADVPLRPIRICVDMELKRKFSCLAAPADLSDGYTGILEDTVHYAGMLATKPLGTIARTRRARVRATKPVRGSDLVTMPPSSVTLLRRVAGDRALDNGHISPSLIPSRYQTQLKQMHNAFAEALAVAHKDKTDQSTTFTPVVSVEHENTQLVFGREGVPLCSAASTCVAANLTASQGPLNAYLLPGQPPDTGMLCLLCTRAHAQLLNQSFENIGGCGSSCPPSAVLLPPTNNLVDVPGGYHSWALGVTPQNCRAFNRACNIVGSAGSLRVRYARATNTWFVDQASLVYQPPTTSGPTK